MLWELVVLFTVIAIFILIVMNVIKIKQLESRYADNVKVFTVQLNTLNAQMANVVSKNNDINVKNVKTLYDKLDSVQNVGESKDTGMSLEIKSLKSKLTFLMENSDIYSLLNVKDDAASSGTSTTASFTPSSIQEESDS
jgi:uncharacterized protein YoxC